MRALQTTLFVLLSLVLATQSFRHVYVKWIEPTGSVLDAYREPVEKDIAASESLEELTQQYAQARAARAAYEDGKPLHQVDLARRTDQGVYRDEGQLRAAIERLEQQDRTLFQLWFYWGCGLFSTLLGLFLYARVNAWTGMVGLITGFVEMAVWTSPLWRSWGPQFQFDALLTTKLVLSFVSLGLLLGLWQWRERRPSAVRTPLAS